LGLIELSRADGRRIMSHETATAGFGRSGPHEHDCRCRCLQAQRSTPTPLPTPLVSSATVGTTNLPTPLVSSATVGTNNTADAARFRAKRSARTTPPTPLGFERSGRHEQICQAGFARPRLAIRANGDSQWAGRSVSWRRRSRRAKRSAPANHPGNRCFVTRPPSVQADRGCAATVGFQASELSTRVLDR